MLNGSLLDLLAGEMKIWKPLKLGHNALMIRVVPRASQPSGSLKQLSAPAVAVELCHTPPFCC